MANNITAVQWLFDELIKHNGIISHEIIEKALEMEKEQIIDAYSNGLSDEGIKSIHTKANAAEYYNETYGE